MHLYISFLLEALTRNNFFYNYSVTISHNVAFDEDIYHTLYEVVAHFLYKW